MIHPSSVDKISINLMEFRMNNIILLLSDFQNYTTQKDKFSYYSVQWLEVINWGRKT